MKINIVSGWSNPGGSTTANLNLTNLFNENGLDCTFYGPHNYHLDKCKGKLFQEYSEDKSTTTISHFIPPHFFKDNKKHIYSCHEKQLAPLSSIDVSQYDTLHFITEQQKEWHNVDHSSSVVIPNVYDELVSGQKTEESKEVAGVIGSIDNNKGTHISIQRAFRDGYKKVLLFGVPTDEVYARHFVLSMPEIDKSVFIMGYEKDKQKMYDSIDAAYLSSKSEVDPLVKGECHLTGTKFYGNEQTIYGQPPMSSSDILDKWLGVLE